MDLYPRYRDPSGKHPDVIEEKRAWDAPRLLAAEQDAYSDLPPGDFRVVTVATREDYLNTRRKSERVIA